MAFEGLLKLNYTGAGTKDSRGATANAPAPLRPLPHQQPKKQKSFKGLLKLTHVKEAQQTRTPAAPAAQAGKQMQQAGQAVANQQQNQPQQQQQQQSPTTQLQQGNQQYQYQPAQTPARPAPPRYSSVYGAGGSYGSQYGSRYGTPYGRPYGGTLPGYTPGTAPTSPYPMMQHPSGELPELEAGPAAAQQRYEYGDTALARRFARHGGDVYGTAPWSYQDEPTQWNPDRDYREQLERWADPRGEEQRSTFKHYVEGRPHSYWGVPDEYLEEWHQQAGERYAKGREELQRLLQTPEGAYAAEQGLDLSPEAYRYAQQQRALAEIMPERYEAIMAGETPGALTPQQQEQYEALLKERGLSGEGNWIRRMLDTPAYLGWRQKQQAAEIGGPAARMMRQSEMAQDMWGMTFEEAMSDPAKRRALDEMVDEESRMYPTQYVDPYMHVDIMGGRSGSEYGSALQAPGATGITPDASPDFSRLDQEVLNNPEYQLHRVRENFLRDLFPERAQRMDAGQEVEPLSETERATAMQLMQAHGIPTGSYAELNPEQRRAIAPYMRHQVSADMSKPTQAWVEEQAQSLGLDPERLTDSQRALIANSFDPRAWAADWTMRSMLTGGEFTPPPAQMPQPGGPDAVPMPQVAQGYGGGGQFVGYAPTSSARDPLARFGVRSSYGPYVYGYGPPAQGYY